MTRLDGKCALVTGASSGLGRHFALTLAGAAADVALAARRVDKLQELAREIEAMGRQAVPVAMDVTNSASVAAAVEAAETGLGQIDILINNAGVASLGGVLEQSQADWDAVMRTNLDGVCHCAREVGRRMAKSGGGSIINIASILALGVSPGLGAYAVSKAAVAQFTKAMAVDVARFNIRVNAIAPGYFATDMNSDYLDSEAGQAMMKRVPQRRFGDLTDLDAPLLLLAGDGASYMTGVILPVDGGHSLPLV